jgi:hypothetical protein
MEKVFDTYATRNNVVRRALRFKMDGESIDPNATPTTLKLENMVQIQCYLEQTGGCFRETRICFWNSCGTIDRQQMSSVTTVQNFFDDL